MATKRESCSPEPSENKRMKYDDLKQLANAFAPEFNNSSMHDRILVFEILEEKIHNGSDCDSESEKSEQENSTCEKNEDLHVLSKPLGKQITTADKIPENPFDVDDGNVKTEKKRDADTEQITKDETAAKLGDEEKVQEKDRQRAALKDKTAEEKDDVCRHELFVHSVLLSVLSPYFKALFYSGMKETHTKEVVMKVTESELQAHLTLIEAMYRADVLDDKEYDLVLKVLALANKYDIPVILRKCTYVLMSTSLTLEKCEGILAVVNDLPECADLRSVLEKFLVEEFKPLDKTWTMEKFNGLSEASLRLLLSSNDLAVQSENTVFVALMSWIKPVHLSSSKSYFLDLVRFELMTVNFLYDIVRNNFKAKQLSDFNKRLIEGLGYHGLLKERQDKLKPAPRCWYEDKGPTFTWIIDKDVRKSIADSSDGVLSDRFWWEGYEMKVGLEYEPITNIYGFYWYVDNLPAGGSLNINCRAVSELFIKKSISICHLYEESGGWGYSKLRGAITLPNVSEDVSHTLDVWVKYE